MTKLTIPGDIFPSLNAVLNSAKIHWRKYYSMQQSLIHLISYYVKRQNIEPIKDYPVHITFRWIMGNRRKDPDNVAAGKKFIVDALVLDGVLKGDEWKYISGFKDEFDIDIENQRVEVIIR